MPLLLLLLLRLLLVAAAAAAGSSSRRVAAGCRCWSRGRRGRCEKPSNVLPRAIPPRRATLAFALVLVTWLQVTASCRRRLYSRGTFAFLRSSSAFTDPTIRCFLSCVPSTTTTAWFDLAAAAALDDHRRDGQRNVRGNALPPGKGGGKGPSFCCCGCRCCCCCCSFFGRGSWRDGEAWRVGFLLV